MKLISKLLLGFGGLWLLFLAATVLSLILLQQHSRTLDDALHSNYDSVMYCERIKASLDDLNQLTMTAVWTRAAPSPAAIDAAVKRYESARDGQQQNITLPGEGEMTARLFQLSAEYQNEVRRFAEVPDEGRHMKFQADLLPRYVAAQAAARSVIDLNLDHMRSVATELRHNMGNTRLVLLTFVGAGAVLAVVSILVLGKTIMEPLRTLTKSARKVEEGDLELNVPVKSRDEIGELAAAFNAMATRLREYRRLDDARLSRLQKTLQLALDSLPDAVAVFNPAGEVEISNHQARTHFGLDPGRREADIKLGWLHDLFRGPLQSGQPVEPSGYTSAVQLFDAGEERFLLPRSVPMIDEQQKVLGVVVVLVDVTRLRQADELKSGLVATVSHELKTPLAATRFAVHVLAQQSVGGLTPAQGRLVDAARDGAERLHRIIENLLDLSRIEAGKKAMRFVSMAPQDIVEQAVGPLRAEFERKGIALTIEMAPELPMLSVDATSVTNALSNLVTNALKFTPSPGWARVTVCASGGGVEFVVEDSGPGISLEHLPRIFDRFYRAPIAGGPTGAGLGLAIAKQIVEAHGGTISAENREGGGGRFVMKLCGEMTGHAGVSPP